ncbi:MAG TPA: phosphodiester glycosidase family protein [Gemmatimonadaceae bacterium]
MRLHLLRAALLSGGAALSFLLLVPRAGAAQSLPASALAVAVGGEWMEWWRSDRAPVAWRGADPTVRRALRWEPVQRGVDMAELRLRGTGEAWRTRVIVVRIDPAAVRLRAVAGEAQGAGRAAWAIDAAPANAIAAFNAGQFTGASPWGWVVRDGVEQLSPGHGPLAPAFVVDTMGSVRWLFPPIAADAAPGVSAAFQSYPTLLVDGAIPAALRTAGSGVDLAHRDARFTLCTLGDGGVLLAMTRFDALGGVLDSAPFGITTPEQAALAGALGCRTAMALDGGISAQLLLRDGAGRVQRWEGMRRVPLGMVVLPR